MNFIRTNIVFKLFTFLFALHILNVSVDPPGIPKDLSINEMESISEIIAEQILHIDNAFPEYSHHDNPDHGSPFAMDFVLMFYHQPVINIIPVTNVQPLFVKYAEKFYPQHSIDILTPPPKA